MAGQVMPGEAILDNRQATKAEMPLVSVETLVADYSLMAFRIAYSILRNHHDAEDTVQESFLRVLRHRERLHEIRNPKIWLARIAWTTALDGRSSRARVSGNEDAAEPDVMMQFRDRRPGAEEQLAGKQMQKLLEQMIAALPENLRHPLELSTVHELNSREIAEILKIPEGSVRTRLMRARQRLKEKLAVLLEAKHG